MITLLGLAAGVLTTSCWLPQLARSYRTRSTRDISWGYLGALSGGILLWLLYGVLAADAPLIVANVATGGLLLTLVLLKRRFDRRARC